jgi:microcystin-dependent protein
MQTPFIGNVIMFGGTFAPVGWAFCDGSLQQISENSALFSLIGTTYGGDGSITFALPDLRGRIPVNQGQGNGLSNYVIGQVGGSETISLLPAHLPPHAHTALENSGTADSTNPQNNYLGSQANLLAYNPAPTPGSVMKSNTISNSPGGQAHNNIMPSLALNYIIALDGVYPPQT